MDNPFEEILKQLSEINSKLDALRPSELPAIEIINRTELCKRLDISVPTAIRYGKDGKLTEIRIGDKVLYNWYSVIGALEKPKTITINPDSVMKLGIPFYRKS